MTDQAQSLSKQTNPLANMSKEEVLYHLLKKEHGYYKAIMEITRQEHQLFEHAQSIVDIKPLLKKKKILLACINEIETALTPLKKYWQSKAERTDYFSGQIKRELEDLNKLLKEILQIDLLSQKSLENLMMDLKTKNKGTMEGSLEHSKIHP